MFAHLSRHGSDPRTTAWQAGTRLRRFAAVLAAVTCALLASAGVVPAAFARMLPDGGPPYRQDLPGAQATAQIHAVASGGMPGWQITLIAAGTAVLAAVLAVTADRARAVRRHAPAPSL
jgi:hypothetical protein